MRLLSLVLALAGCTPGAAKDDRSDSDTLPTDTTIDEDSDGVQAEDDCDDGSAALGAVSDDEDCDGVLASEDCDDLLVDRGALSHDADCDGSLAGVDCDDADPGVTIHPSDQDCDGTAMALDCDDADASSTVVAFDQDCDGLLNVDDCDDTDAAVVFNADSEACVAWFGAIDIEEVLGHSYVLDFSGVADGPDSNPRGIYRLFSIGRGLTVTLASATAGLLDETFFTSGYQVQDMCEASRDLGGYSEIVGSPHLTLASWPSGGPSFLGGDLSSGESAEMVLTGRVDPSADRIVDIHLREVNDFRSPGWALVLADDGWTAQSICTIIGGCFPCATDGASFCIVVDWVGITANRVTPAHVEVTADDVLNNPSCTY